MVISRMLLAMAKPNRHLGPQAQLSWETSKLLSSLGTQRQVSQHWEDESEEAPASHSASFYGPQFIHLQQGRGKGAGIILFHPRPVRNN